MHSKDFERWSSLKKKLDVHRHTPIFHEREIWWCSVGMNIGYEIYGKGSTFTRPVLIIRKFSPFTFLGLPLSTKFKKSEYYYPIKFHTTTTSAVFDQIRTLDAKRLADFIVKLPEDHFDEIKTALLARVWEPYTEKPVSL